MLGPKTANSLLVAVEDSSTGNPIEGASVELEKDSVFIGSKLTGGSIWSQQDWSGGSGQANFSDATRYYQDDGNVSVNLSGRDHGRRGGLMGFLSDVGGAITRTALLFVFGTVLLALGTQRMEAMQGEVAARPMRTFALGVVGTLVGGVALIALCVTVVGIPIALLGALLAVLGIYAGICAALTTVGAAIFHHKSKSPYVHLAIGCVLFLIATSLPWIGGFVTAGVVLFGFGALVATRGAGFFPRKTKNDGPYRTATA